MPTIIADVDDSDTEIKTKEESDGTRTYTTRHLVTTTVADVTEKTLLADELFPQVNVAVFAADSLAKLRGRAVERWENAYQWWATLTWSTKRDEEHEDEDPFERPVVGSIRCVDKEVPAFEDSRGVLMRNTAGDLYKGLTNVTNTEIIDIVLYSQEYPFALRSVNNTVNAAAVTMFGQSYARRTLWMKNLRLPAKPTEIFATQFWETQFEAHHDPAGYYELLPNTGLHEIQYWIREEDEEGPPRTFTDWEPVDFATYDAESDSELKQATRERIETGSGQSVADEVWLNEHGEAIVPSLLQDSGTASLTSGSPTVTVTGSSLDSSYVGTMATFLITDTSGAQTPIKVRVKQVNSATSFTMDHNANATAAGVPVVFAGGGALFNYFERQYASDWSNVPLPATPPDLGNS